MNIRRNLLVSMALLTALTAPALAQKDSPTKLSLTEIKPTELLEMILDPREPALLPDGITMLSPDDANRFLLVEGTEEGMKRLREIIRLVDVPQKAIRLEVRVLLQSPVAGMDKPKQEVIAMATLQMKNNRPGQARMVGQGRVFYVQITPHLNGDGTFTLHASFTHTRRSSQGDGSFQSSERALTSFRRIRGDRPEVLVSLAVGNNPRSNREGASNHPEPQSPLPLNVPAFLLEVKPTVVAPAEGKNSATITQPKRQGQTAK